MRSSFVVKREGRLWLVSGYVMEFCRISLLIASIFAMMCELLSSAEREDGGGGVKF